MPFIVIQLLCQNLHATLFYLYVVINFCLKILREVEIIIIPILILNHNNVVNYFNDSNFIKYKYH